MANIKPLMQQNHVFINPDSCGSGVGYYLTVYEYTIKDGKVTYSLSANVVLSDCSHKINWNFCDSADISKIEAAIQMLREFKKKLSETLTIIDRLNKAQGTK